MEIDVLPVVLRTIALGFMVLIFNYLIVNGFKHFGKHLMSFTKELGLFFKNIIWLIKEEWMIKIVWYMAAVLLFLGATSMPSDYYFIMRILVFCACVYVIFWNIGAERSSWAIVFGIIGLIFNPIFPVYLYDKTTWMILDITSGIAFIYNSAIIFKRPS